jgi:type IV pilus assembly protein PilC
VLAVAAVAFALYVGRGRPAAVGLDLLHVPVFGPLFRKVAISRFSRTFATLIQSGVPMLGALDIVAATAGNVLVEAAVLKAKDAVTRGETLSDPLTVTRVFPPMVTRMISIGEKTGALEKLLMKIAEFYDQEVRATVKSLTSLIEPLMISAMGFIVGFIVLSIFLPIIRMTTAVTIGRRVGEGGYRRLPERAGGTAGASSPRITPMHETRSAYSSLQPAQAFRWLRTASKRTGERRPS